MDLRHIPTEDLLDELRQRFQSPTGAANLAVEPFKCHQCGVEFYDWHICGVTPYQTTTAPR